MIEKSEMGNLLYLLAFFLVTSWAIGFFILSAGILINLLLLLASGVIIFGIIRE